MSIIVDNGALILPQSGGILIAANVNNADPGNGSTVYVSQLSTGISVTGMSGGEADRVLICQATRNSPQSPSFEHQHASSSAANRHMTASNSAAFSNFGLQNLMWIYDAVEQRWKEV
jgi:hypothetical protein